MSSSSGSRSPSRSTPSPRSKSKQSVSFDMFPNVCSRSFVNRTRKIAFQELADDLKIETEYEDSDGEVHEYTKGMLCLKINDLAKALNKKATVKSRKTKRKVKNPRSHGPVKAAHKS